MQCTANLGDRANGDKAYFAVIEAMIDGFDKISKEYKRADIER